MTSYGIIKNRKYCEHEACWNDAPKDKDLCSSCQRGVCGCDVRVKREREEYEKRKENG